MPSAQYKAAAGETLSANGRRRQHPSSREGKERRRKLIAAINATESERAEEAEASLTKYLDEVYPETRLPAQ